MFINVAWTKVYIWTILSSVALFALAFKISTFSFLFHIWNFLKDLNCFAWENRDNIKLFLFSAASLVERVELEKQYLQTT